MNNNIGFLGSFEPSYNAGAFGIRLSTRQKENKKNNRLIKWIVWKTALK